MIQIGFSRDMKLLRSGVLYRYLHVASHVAWSRRRSMKIVVNQLRVLPHNATWRERVRSGYIYLSHCFLD